MRFLKHNDHLNKTKAIFSLNIIFQKIEETKIKKFGVSVNYYSQRIEGWLGQNIESPFGDIVSLIRKQLKNNTVKLSAYEKQFIYKFCHYSLIRAPRQISQMNETALYSYSD